ncbi:phosphotransferase enzyme family protein [Bogoriella caseilytica]|uniref:Homoserine kinase type II n=1 Tax=Bogoriella caseilytica TaxID=56055 RepID=A0A3N2BGQ1_9MICO|nr:phosphotransferase [Bogoriella caseilytica]ROR74417.1 homoserine kinase type II [Bogoriella caseilytica]
MPELPATRLEMLWESEHPLSTLQTRFGFADAESAARWVGTTLRERWGIDVITCARVVMSARNAIAWLSTDDGPMLAKWSVAAEHFTRLEGNARLVQWLHAQGCPVSAPLPCRNGEVQVELPGASIGVQRVMGGSHLDVDDAAQVRAAGAALARLHHALSTYPEAERLAGPLPAAEPLTVRLGRWFDRAGTHIPASACQALRSLVATAGPEPTDRQLVHGDIRSANILCDGPSVAAFIDFDEVRRDHRIDEIARSAVLLGTQFHDWGPVSPEVHAAYLAGYVSVSPLTPQQRARWEVLVLWYSLAFVSSGDDPTGSLAAARQHSALSRTRSARARA